MSNFDRELSEQNRAYHKELWDDLRDNPADESGNLRTKRDAHRELCLPDAESGCFACEEASHRAHDMCPCCPLMNNTQREDIHGGCLDGLFIGWHEATTAEEKSRIAGQIYSLRWRHD